MLLCAPIELMQSSAKAVSTDLRIRGRVQVTVSCTIRVGVTVAKSQLNDQDEAARSAGEGGREKQRAREAGPPEREEGWDPEEGGQGVLGLHIWGLRLR